MAIWDSIDDLQQHPLRVRALENVKLKIQNCLCESYTICDKDEVVDHKQVFIGLPGRFLVGPAVPLPDIGTVIGPALPPQMVEGDDDDDDDVEYAETGSDGITFNHALVNASTAYYNGGDDDELITESYVSLFEETIEHELAYVKMHQERLDGSFDEEHLTPDGPPYCGESNFAMQRLIRGRAHSPVTESPSILEVSGECADRNFAPPLDLWLSPLQYFDEESSVPEGNYPPVTLEQLRSHMGYPSDCTERKRERGATALTVQASGGKRAKTDASKPAARDPSSSQSRQGGSGSGEGSGSGREEAQDRQTQSCTDKYGKDRNEQRKNTPKSGNSAKSCHISRVVFCDKERKETTTFRPFENIYVLLTFKNPTRSDAYIKCSRKTFQRIGIFQQIDGHPMNYVPCPPRNVPLIRIPPGEEYTFFVSCAFPRTVGHVECAFAPQKPRVCTWRESNITQLLSSRGPFLLQFYSTDSNSSSRPVPISLPNILHCPSHTWQQSYSTTTMGHLSSSEADLWVGISLKEATCQKNLDY